jgi:hypothetical protein
VRVWCLETWTCLRVVQHTDDVMCLTLCRTLGGRCNFVVSASKLSKGGVLVHSHTGAVVATIVVSGDGYATSGCAYCLHYY